VSIKGNREHRRAAAKYLQEQNLHFPAHLISMPRNEWPQRAPRNLVLVWRSRSHLVQVFSEGLPGVLVRLSVNRTGITPAGGWVQDIPWEDMQRLKSEAGYGDFDAVEVFPRDADVVNVANMRHLWVLVDRLPYAWRSA
jgi:hypothetical protein